MRSRPRPPRSFPVVGSLVAFATLAAACSTAEGKPRGSRSPRPSWSPSVITTGSPEGGFDAGSLEDLRLRPGAARALALQLREDRDGPIWAPAN